LHGILCCVWLYVCDANYVYVHMLEGKELGDFRVWKLIQSVYGIKTKVEAKDLLKDKYQYFPSVLLCVIYDFGL